MRYGKSSHRETEETRYACSKWQECLARGRAKPNPYNPPKCPDHGLPMNVILPRGDKTQPDEAIYPQA